MPPLREADHRALRLDVLEPVRCTVCGVVGRAEGWEDNLRESGRCVACGATNRQRQLAHVAVAVTAVRLGLHAWSLRDVVQAAPDLDVYNTEASGPIHEVLVGLAGYRASEFIDPSLPAGAMVEGVEHQDLVQLGHGDARFDLVLSSDVLEHVPEPYEAHAHIRRVLRPGGHHVFTVPFHPTWLRDELRAERRPDGTVVHLRPPLYHHDPLRPEGALVYRIFAIEMLVRLAELGLHTHAYDLHEPDFGIIGRGSFVFDAIRVQPEVAGEPQGGS
ncbi:MAG TPA: class I SAM-dependent methyltransferase [Nitriliruptorales bacterium]